MYTNLGPEQLPDGVGLVPELAEVPLQLLEDILYTNLGPEQLPDGVGLVPELAEVPLQLLAPADKNSHHHGQVYVHHHQTANLL